MAEAKDLNYYMANPDELPDDADLSALANGIEAAEPEQETEDVKEGESSDAKEAKADAEVKPEEKEPDPVLKSKNGREEIPYQVLVSERERRAAAEKAAEDLRKQLDSIEAQVKAGGQPKQEEPVKAPAEVVDDDTLQQLSEDFPTIGKVISALQAKVIAAEQKLQEVAQIEGSRQAREAAVKRDEVQEAIDATPALLYWQGNDAEMFGKAIEFDNILKADARNASLTLAERFEKVVAAMETVYGAVELPAGYIKAESPRQDMNELTEKAKAVVKEAGSFKPKSLSDIPGGSPPASTDSEKFETMSPAQLASMMQGMDSDSINVMLAKLG